MKKLILVTMLLTGCSQFDRELLKAEKYKLSVSAFAVGPVMVPILIPTRLEEVNDDNRPVTVVQAPGSIVSLPGNNTVTIIPTAYNVVKADETQCSKHGNGVVLHVWVDMDADGVYKPTVDQGLTSTVVCAKLKKEKKDRHERDDRSDRSGSDDDRSDDREEKKCNKKGKGGHCK
jgi:hypothetical protein